MRNEDLEAYRQRKDDAMRGYKVHDEQMYPREPDSKQFSEHDGDAPGLHAAMKVKKGYSHDRMPRASEEAGYHSHDLLPRNT
jgi:hypothetical protein